MKRSHISIISFIFGIVFIMTSIGFTKKETQEDRLLQISNEYKRYYRYDIADSAALNWTITLCASAKMTILTDSFHISKATLSSSQHGNKLYKLFVKDIKSYNDTTIKFQPDGQIIVKETWNVEAVSKDSLSNTTVPVKQSMNDGKWYIPTTVSELFVMYKEPKGENNDEGWVYGIVNLEDKNQAAKILENGKISSCISCHAGTKYDRIFGGE